MARLRHVPAVAVLLAVLVGVAPARAAAPGSLDSSFGGGVVTLGSDTQLFGVGVEPSGEVIAAGQSGGRVLVQCFSSSGALAGRYLGGAGAARAVAIQPGGQAVVAGSSGGMFAQRFNANCTPDASFHAGTPVVAASLGGGAVANGVAIGPGGTIVVAGSVPHVDSNGESTRPAVARFTAGGALDPSFASGGADVIDHGHPYAVATAVAVQSDGKIVLAGNWRHPVYQVTFGWVERLMPSGQDDSTFGAGTGIYNYASGGSGYASLNAVAIQVDGKIVAAGSDLSPPPGVNQGPSAAVVRLDASGNPDPGFGSAGVSKLSAGTFTPDPYGAYGVGVAGGGGIVGAGAIMQNSSHDAGLWAFSPGGAPDTEGAFGSGATVVKAGGIEACAMAVAPDGSLVIVGDSVAPARQGPACEVNGTSSAFAARYLGFGPPPPATPPTATTGSATRIGEVSATVNGAVNPSRLATAYHFDYGRSSSYGSSTSAQSAGSGGSATTVHAELTGLTPATTYHYRPVASNADGTSTGADQTFVTVPAARPSISAGSSVAVTEVSATLAARLNPSGLPTTYHFEYGRTITYGTKTASATLAAGSGAIGVSARIRGLRPGVTYHYRLVARNARGRSHGADRTFKTAPRLTVRLRGVSQTYSLVAIGRNGLQVTVSCDQPCSLRGSLVIPLAQVKALKLGRRPLTVARGSGSLARRGARVLHVTLTADGMRLVGHVAQVAATLQVVGDPTGGGPRRTVSRSVSLTR